MGLPGEIVGLPGELVRLPGELVRLPGELVRLPATKSFTISLFYAILHMKPGLRIQIWVFWSDQGLNIRFKIYPN